MDHLILTLSEKGILVSVSDGNLLVNAPAGTLTDDMVRDIKKHKSALIQYLSGSREDSVNRMKAIEPVPHQPDYPLSSTQRRLWVLSRFKTGNIAYNMNGTFILEGALNGRLLEHSIHQLIERHESLRTVFRENEQGEVRQHILQPGHTGFSMTSEDISWEKDPEIRATEIIHEEYDRPFDLSMAPLVRAGLYQLNAEKWLFTYTLHHIISDGWSMEVLINELLQVYNNLAGGEEYALAPLRIQYKDYAAWQQQQVNEEKLSEHKKYWLQIFRNGWPVLELPTDNNRPSIKTYRGGEVHRTIPDALLQNLKVICVQNQATLFMGLTAATYTLLSRYAGQEDMVIGSAIAGRDHSDLEDQIGFYVRTIPLRFQCPGKENFHQLLAHVKQVTLDAHEHQEYPFDELVDALEMPAPAGRNTLFDVMIELRDKYRINNHASTGLNNIIVSAFEGSKPVFSKFDLTFFFTESVNGLNLLVEYNADIFHKETAERICRHLEQLLASITSQPGKPLRELDYIPAAERHQLLNEFNDTQKPFQKTTTILDLFIAQVQQTPEAVAIEYDEQTLSYRELHERSNRLANYLVAHFNLQPGSLAGILLNRSDNMIIALLGILKAGAAYVPIDVDYPLARKTHILTDSALNLLITESGYIYELAGYEGNTFAIDIEWDGIPAADRMPAVTPQPGDAAYLIYTSGSTGQPKGCVLTHSNLYNYIRWANDYYFNTTHPCHFGLFTSLSFDLTITSIYCTLTQGGKLYIYQQNQEPAEVLRHCFSNESGINSIKLTPSHINMLAHLNIVSETPMIVIIGGEEVTKRHVQVLKQLNVNIIAYNEYGPTETTVGCVATRLYENTTVLIGKPVYNTKIYVLDEGRALCGTGIPGEIYVSGDSVGRGYYNNKALTDERFITDPFVPAQTMYKTGDRGKWLPDGNLVFMARKDEQVKIRGYRVELGEIESVLKNNAAIKEAVVLAKKDEQLNNNLVAFYVPLEPYDEENVRISMQEDIKDQLPIYMMPAFFYPVEAIPLTVNGKVNKPALLALASIASGQTTYVPPQTDIEQKLVTIWQDVIGREKIGIKDSFFELGGHSLIATRLIAKISREFDMDYSFDTLFSSPTIEEMAREIERTNWVSNNFSETELTGNTQKYLI